MPITRAGNDRRSSSHQNRLRGGAARTPARWLFGFGLLAAGLAQAAIPASERAVLDSLYANTHGENWTEQTGWEGAAGSECQWAGIDCIVTADGEHISGLTLIDNNLSGPLPELAGLTHLQFLDAEINQLSGPIPAINTLADLRIFDVFANQLDGSIPDLTDLSMLVTFDVSINRLTGSIPELTGLGQLKTFDVTDNRLGGTVPALDGLALLQRFRIGGNRIGGTMPDPPSPSALVPGGSSLCTASAVSGANLLAPTPNAAWDIATATTPWFRDCDSEAIFADSYDE